MVRCVSSRYRCVEVEVLEVDRAEAHTFSIQDTVKKELEKFEQCSVGTDVAWGKKCNCHQW